MKNGHNSLDSSGRLASLDVFRGLTMICLVSGGFGLPVLADDPVWGFLGRQFTHHPWHGLRFEDLIQPFFMFIVGVAMPFSFGKRWERGDTWGQTFLHVLRRSAILFTLGVALHISYRGKYVFELWNVLTQLSATYLIAFLFMRKPLRTQIVVSFAFLLANYLMYRFIPLPGVTDPWEKDHNFGAYMDMLLMGKINPGGGWVAINFIGSTAHTMWGVIAGCVLRSARSDREKLKLLVIGGVIGVVLGLALDPITPIVKRICTSSFIIESGGAALLTLALAYWAIDMKGWKSGTKTAVVFGMNPIALYLLNEFFGGAIRKVAGAFTKQPLAPLGALGDIIGANIVLGIYVYIAWWLYKHKIFIRI